MDNYDVRVDAEPRPRKPIVDLDDPDVREYLLDNGWIAPLPQQTTCTNVACWSTYEMGRGACPFCGCAEPD